MKLKKFNKNHYCKNSSADIQENNFNYIHTYKFETNDKTLTTFSSISDHTYTSTPLQTPTRHPRPRAQFPKSKPRPVGITEGPGWRPQAVGLGRRSADSWAETWEIGPWGVGVGLARAKAKTPDLFSKKKTTRASPPPRFRVSDSHFHRIFARKRQCNDYRR